MGTRDRSGYWNKWREEPSDQEIYDDIRKSLREDDEDDEEYYARNSGYNRGSSSSNQRYGGGYSNNFHHNPDEKLRKLASTYQRIQDFFIALGEDINTYFVDPMDPNKRMR